MCKGESAEIRELQITKRIKQVVVMMDASNEIIYKHVYMYGKKARTRVCRYY
jgi:DNA repair protein RadC